MGSPAESLVQSILDGRTAVARSLLAKNPDLATAVVWHGLTPLHAAAETDDDGTAVALLDAGADLTVRAEWGHDPATWAVVCGSERVARRLVERGAELTPAIAAGLGRTADLPEALGPADRNEAFWLACRNGRLETAQRLRSRGGEPGVPGWMGGTALHWAAHGGHAEVVSWLIGEGADATRADNELSLDAAGWAAEGRREAVPGDWPRIYRLLAKAGATVTVFDWIDLGETREVRRALDEKPGLVDARRKTATPLHVAVSAGRAEVVAAVLDYGPELSLEDAEGRTPLMIAMLDGKHEIADLIRRRLYMD
ncbi:MAG: ankyrin repeat domain-containing protein [Planctomycetota bacterium]